MDVLLSLVEPRVLAARINEPLTVGIPLPRGAAATTDAWRLESADGTSLPLQARALDRWHDGSIRWALLDFLASTGAGVSGPLRLDLDATGPAVPDQAVSARAAGNDLVVATGGVTFVLSGRAQFLFASVAADGKPLLEPTATRLRVVNGVGELCDVRWQDPVVEERGLVRTAVRFEGEIRDWNTRLDLVARLHFYAGCHAVRLQLTVRNPRRAIHRGGFWELGDKGSILLRELAVVLVHPGTTPVRWMLCWTEAGKPARAVARRFEVHQASSGGANWRSTNHVNRFGIVPNRFRGYSAHMDGDIIGGLRAAPVVVLESAGGALGAMMPAFWQNFPRAIEAVPQCITLGLLPRQHPDAHELQGGEQKTHDMYLLFGSDTVTQPPLDWCRDRLMAHAPPEWYAFGVPYLTPAAADPHRKYLDLVDAAIVGDDTIEAKRERIDEYGWRHFGDIYGDHEAVYPRTPQAHPLVSHCNNLDDAIAGFAYQFMRTADARWHRLAAELAAHVVDIDIYHTVEDVWAYNHGLFLHTVHHVDAGRATHRSYPRAAGSSGGGPSCEHNYTTGLMLRYFLTGDLAARETAADLAQFVIDLDDGNRTPFRWLDHGYTGLCTASGDLRYQGPGRVSGNSLNALLDGHRLTGERRFLDKAEQVIARCVHPQQDLVGLNLGDVERRWFYTVFLHSLAKYLDHKLELDEMDAAYDYARASLLHYARWMEEHEYPYLERPWVLQYPTETWAAQDVRKSEVFRYAAMHATGGERGRFAERADYFFDYAISTLERMPSRTLARPVVLLASHGWMHAYFRHYPDMPVPAPVGRVGQWPPPLIFVPQRTRAIRRARRLAVAAIVLLAAAAAAAVLSLL